MEFKCSLFKIVFLKDVCNMVEWNFNFSSDQKLRTNDENYCEIGLSSFDTGSGKKIRIYLKTSLF